MLLEILGRVALNKKLKQSLYILSGSVIIDIT